MGARDNSAQNTSELAPAMRCAQCGDRIYIASWSEHVDDRRVKYLWECDACGYAFETLVALAAPRFDRAA